MRSVAGMGAATVLMMGPGVAAGVSPTPQVSTAPASTAPPVSTAPTSTAPTSGASVTGGSGPDGWKKRTSLRVLPQWPRQNNNVRILAHCPTAANHAIIGSTAFTLKGSTRLYREVGLGLSDRGLGRRAVSISYYALPGYHEVCMKCVKVTIDQKTRIRKIRVISRYSVPLQVRRFRIAQFFD
ncbi:hypothetical protein [Streptosporangium roseum]|uniref:Secreted protein n=1 Tax=Streptosporangium roseum (strain ATCC 12428 / DSM 43021 / JCM 3005 / KCTC 9067 / NCIMB 10171 / NRRL 2505 / NI 9100) TaxID=479432 RepID=D2B970_STRRD|nr:hypothetical protein [Streptosporangium roseum]ACZ91615.1 hypothetical protein Sros_8984 [Streptosporangium roseum DSM 43021]